MMNSFGVRTLFLLASATCIISDTNVARANETADRHRTEVTISQGKLRGIKLTTRLNRTVSGFLAIPYAQPPVGNLRFANPIPARNWSGTLDASHDASPCTQPGDEPGVSVGDEDCLYLNVFTPQLPTVNNSTLLPVMMFIHGGGFEFGDNNSSFFGPQYLLDKHVVLVVPNYRLGMFGFLSTGDEVVPGNFGMKDQVLALEWIRDNIARFGGDPGRVTIFGQSSGGVSAQLLSLSPLAAGLFQRCIAESGSVFAYYAFRPSSSYANRAVQLGGFVGCPTNTSEQLVKCLRNVNASDLIATTANFIAPESHGSENPIWAPTNEPPRTPGAFLTDSPANIYASGNVRDIPRISGSNRDESGLLYPVFLDDLSAFESILKDFEVALPYILDYHNRVENESAYTAAIKSFYFNDDFTQNTTQLLYNYTVLIKDSWINFPVYKAIRKTIGLSRQPQFLYSFEYRGTYSNAGGSTADYGVVHRDELLYLFDQLQVKFGSDAKLSRKDSRMVDTMVELWTSFAISGTPTSSDLQENHVTWEPFSSADTNLRIGNDRDLLSELRYSFLTERMEFWEHLTDTTYD